MLKPLPTVQPESYVTTGHGSVAYVGPDAVALYRATILRASLDLYHKSNGRIIPTRGMTITKMLAATTGITQKPYKRTQAIQAMEDLTKWILAMRAALPLRTSEG